MKFNVQCGRCAGSGRFDRGTCFECKGARFVKKARKPVSQHIPYTFIVRYENGSTNEVQMYFSDKALAQLAIERQLAIKGWKGEVTCK